MPTRPLLIIANPKAGGGRLAPTDLEHIVRRHAMPYELRLASSPAEAAAIAEAATPEQYDAVAVYGGDGTVIAVIKVTLNQQLPVLILPGGTANVMARHLRIPADIDACLRSYASRNYAIYPFPLARLSPSSEPLVLHLHLGMSSRAVTDASKHHKHLTGRLAYMASLLASAPTSSKHHYELEVDGRTISAHGYSCTIVNAGNLDVLGLAVSPRYRPGLVHAVIAHSKNPLTFLQWYAWRLLSGRNLKKAVTILPAKSVTVLRSPKASNVDDEARTLQLPLHIEAHAFTARLVVPIGSAAGLQRIRSQARLAVHRYGDHIRRLLVGAPFDRFSRIDRHLYLGGQYSRKAIGAFASSGITGIISMRERVPRPLKKASAIQLLHLPTPDHAAPTLQTLLKGIAFIRQHAEQGGAVYVHCRLGEGRGPSMAAAYLISQGLTADDALHHLQRFRPFARPNAAQRRRLEELAVYLIDHPAASGAEPRSTD
ncbi:dual specificity protein phosphatase family protein [Candidatus Saccharibacteria bacterium]|nr:dual specificity protein phosphatase family protein [Candidatus Saccharibacteria bacterium]